MVRRRVRLARWQRVVLLAGVAILGVVACTRTWSEPPERAEVEAWRLGGEVVAYEVFGREPHIVFRRGDGRVVFGHLKLDWTSIEWPPAPRWQLSGHFVGIFATDGPASVGVSRCWPDDDRPRPEAGEVEDWLARCDGPAVVFGQINDPRIVVLEVGDGVWSERHRVAAPGFIVQADELSEGATRFRFLDEVGAVVWETER